MTLTLVDNELAELRTTTATEQLEATFEQSSPPLPVPTAGREALIRGLVRELIEEHGEALDRLAE